MDVLFVVPLIPLPWRRSMGHLLRADAFVGDFVPPSDFVERRKRPRRNLTPAEEREERIAALRDSSGEEPFAPQDMDAFGDPEVIPGLWPEEGFGIMTIEEMERHERVSNSVSLPTWPEHPSWKKEKH